MKYVWRLIYFFFTKTKSLDAWLVKTERIKLFKRFEPFLYFNEEGKQWQIHFSDESYFA